MPLIMTDQPSTPGSLLPIYIEPTSSWITLGTSGYQGEMFDSYSKRVIEFVKKYEGQTSDNPSEWSRYPPFL
jgi:hypothetical protein